MTLDRIEGVVKNYAWGSRTALAEVLGRAPSVEPEAELWFGAHAGGPALLIDGGGKTLGDALGAGRTLPFLFKVLAAAEPLSLQVHPNQAQAEEGYERERAVGLSTEDPRANYKDSNHKPELICALSDFHMVSGFVEPTRAAARFEALGLLEREVAIRSVALALSNAPSEQTFRACFESLFRLGADEIARTVAIIVDAISKERFEEADRGLSQWVLRVAARYPKDPGVVALWLMHYVVLRSGQAAYLPAQKLHAYLEGVGLEIMASSDNVLRGGLTSKHVDAKELQRILDFSSGGPDLVEPFLRAESGLAARVYRTPATEFELVLFELETSRVPWRFYGPAVALVLDGRVTLTSGAVALALQRGEAAFLNYGEELELGGQGRLALVGCQGLAEGDPRASGTGVQMIPKGGASGDAGAK